MKPLDGGRRTRIRIMRAKRDKRRFKRADGSTTPNGGEVTQLLTRRPIRKDIEEWMT